jgi:hypothetical protein
MRNARLQLWQDIARRPDDRSRLAASEGFAIGKVMAVRHVHLNIVLQSRKAEATFNLVEGNRTTSKIGPRHLTGRNNWYTVCGMGTINRYRVCIIKVKNRCIIEVRYVCIIKGKYNKFSLAPSSSSSR